MADFLSSAQHLASSFLSSASRSVLFSSASRSAFLSSASDSVLFYPPQILTRLAAFFLPPQLLAQSSFLLLSLCTFCTIPPPEICSWTSHFSSKPKDSACFLNSSKAFGKNVAMTIANQQMNPGRAPKCCDR